MQGELGNEKTTSSDNLRYKSRNSSTDINTVVRIGPDDLKIHTVITHTGNNYCVI